MIIEVEIEHKLHKIGGRERRTERERQSDGEIEKNTEREIPQTLYIRTSCGSGGRMSS